MPEAPYKEETMNKVTTYTDNLIGMVVGKILAKGGENSTTDELCRNVDKSANAHFNYRLPPFANILLAAVFRQPIT